MTTNDICPHLGLLDDPKTRKLFPDSCHACHQARPPRPLILSHQREVCLVADHKRCEGYTSAWAGGFPKKLRNRNCRKTAPLNLKTLRLIGALVLGLALLLGLGLGLGSLAPSGVATLEGGFQLPDPTDTPAPVTREPGLVLPLSPGTNPTPEQSPTPEHSPTPTEGPQLMTPFGGDPLTFAVYQVQDGDTLQLIAARHNTTVDLIQQLNTLERPTLWIGEVLVLCLGCQENPGLPTLRPVFLEAPTTLEELAARCRDCDPGDLARWNGLGQGEHIPAGRWVILPDR